MELPSIEEFKKLKERQDHLLQKALEAKGLVAAKKAELQKILDKHGVKSLEELKKLFAGKEKRAVELLASAEVFIEQTSKKLEELEKKISSTSSEGE
jgi:TRAP-type C4-dicarboxylate transport system substrate-binding protein